MAIFSLSRGYHNGFGWNHCHKQKQNSTEWHGKSNIASKAQSLSSDSWQVDSGQRLRIRIVIDMECIRTTIPTVLFRFLTCDWFKVAIWRASKTNVPAPTPLLHGHLPTHWLATLILWYRLVYTPIFLVRVSSKVHYPRLGKTHLIQHWTWVYGANSCYVAQGEGGRGG